MNRQKARIRNRIAVVDSFLKVVAVVVAVVMAVVGVVAVVLSCQFRAAGRPHCPRAQSLCGLQGHPHFYNITYIFNIPLQNNNTPSSF